MDFWLYDDRVEMKIGGKLIDRIKAAFALVMNYRLVVLGKIHYHEKKSTSPPGGYV